MATLSRDRRVRAFRAADEFAVETYRVSRTLNQRLHPGLIDEIRRAAVRSGGALVAASGSPAGGATERRLLEQARTGLLEGRYYLNIARRIGLLDLKRYRGLTTRQDVALRELDAILNTQCQDRPP
jgi:four helix bundle protein